MTDQLTLPEHIATIPDALGFWAERTPEAPALFGADGAVLTHRALSGHIGRVVAKLGTLGLRRQSRIVLLIPSGFEAEIVLLAAMSAATAVPLIPSATMYELKRDLQRIAASLVVVAGQGESHGAKVAAELEIPVCSVDELLAIEASPAHSTMLPEPVPEDIAIIRHTSGTTGLPKRVPLPHRTLLASARAAHAGLGVAAHDVALFSSGLQRILRPVHVLSAIATGGSCAVLGELAPTHFRTMLEQVRPTWMLSTPTELGGLLDAASVAGIELGPVPESRLRAIAVVGQAPPHGLAERAEASLGAPVLVRYGMTEASCISWNGLTEAERREGSSGRPLGSAVRIVDEGAAELAAGEIGEIVIRGSTLFPGYLDDDMANAAAFLPGGWFRTGDLGYVDRDGFLFVTGRIKDVINRGAVKISAAEIDAVLLAHPDVREAAVFAIPDRLLGEDMVAALVLREGSTLTTRGVRSWLFDRFSLQHAPRRIWFVEQLPRTESGKVQRGELTRQWLAKQA